MLEIWPLADHASGAVLCVVAVDGGCMGVTAIHGHRRRDAMPAVGMRLSLQAYCHRALGQLYTATG
jgi:hypothetical protein